MSPSRRIAAVSEEGQHQPGQLAVSMKGIDELK
jgi:hypothetical protein